MIGLPQPLRSLQEGHWFKLICGASYQHLPAVRNLTLAYTLAGADCIDVAADPAVIHAARHAMAAAVQLQAVEMGEVFKPTQHVSLGSLLVADSESQNLPIHSPIGHAPKGGQCMIAKPLPTATPDLQQLGSTPHSPWLMVSLNDGEDPHFRKAAFNPAHCPPDCAQPCVSICPADAIVFNTVTSGVIAERCYGCGRCLPVCPIQHITATPQVAQPTVIGPLITQGLVDALEIHTQVGHGANFEHLWRQLAPYINHLKLLAISCQDGEGVLDYLQALYELCSPLPCPLIWQTDGRPMSGDIGAGTTRATIKFGSKVLKAQLPGHVQLAGGTNWQTAVKLRNNGLLNPRLMARDADRRKRINPHHYIAGIAYGSFARKLLAPLQTELETQTESHHLEHHPSLLRQATLEAFSLVSQLKPFLDQGRLIRLLDTRSHGRDSPRPLAG